MISDHDAETKIVITQPVIAVEPKGHAKTQTPYYYQDVINRAIVLGVVSGIAGMQAAS